MRGFHHDAPVAAPSKAGDPTGPGARFVEALAAQYPEEPAAAEEGMA